MGYLDYFSKVQSPHVVVSLDEYLTQATLPDWVVLGVELIKTMKCVTILKPDHHTQECKQPRMIAYEQMGVENILHLSDNKPNEIKSQ